MNALVRSFRFALASFALAGLTGALIRFWMLAGFPPGISFVNVRHAHSHWMYFGWVTPALMALIAARLPGLTGRRMGRAPRIAIGMALALSMLTAAAFFAWGYQPVAFAGRRLPLAAIASTLHFIPWATFMLFYWRITREIKRTRPLRLWDAALVCMGVSALAGLGRAMLGMLKIDDPFLAAASVHLFLDLFSEGWFLLGLLGLAYLAHPGLAQTRLGLPDWLIFAGLPVTFLLGVPLNLVPSGLRVVAGAGGLLVAAGLGWHVVTLLRRLDGEAAVAWRLPLLLLGGKVMMQAGIALPPVAAWGESLGLRVFYLHVLLLGVVTLGLLAAARQAWGRKALPAAGLLSAAVLLLLASLVPLTGLWPAAWRGPWALELAAWIALAPVAASLMILLLALKKRLQLSPTFLYPLSKGRRAFRK